MTPDLSSALPERFDFYHLGSVDSTAREATKVSALAAKLAGLTKIGFSLQGDVVGLLIVGFGSSLDASTYMEMGNVIASRLATELSRRDRLDVMISPPRALGEEVFARTLAAYPEAEPAIHRTYSHRENSIQAIVLLGRGQEGRPDA